MIDNWPLLTIITFLPLAGVIFLLMIKGDDEIVANNARGVTLWITGFNFIVSLALLLGFDSNVAGYQFEEFAEWLPNFGCADLPNLVGGK